LKVLKRENIEFDFVVGTSIGALMAAGYALGVPIEEMEKEALEFSAKDLLELTIPRMGLSDGNKLERIIRNSIRNKSFADLKIPLYVVTTDVENGTEVIFSEGDLTQAIKASCSLPGIFTPVTIDGKLLIDGGIINSVPVSVAYNMGADFVVATDVGFCVRRGGRMTNILQVIIQSLQIMGRELNKHQARHADVVIKPDLKDIDQLAFSQAAETIEAGMKAAEEKIAIIKRHMKKKYGIF